MTAPAQHMSGSRGRRTRQHCCRQVRPNVMADHASSSLEGCLCIRTSRWAVKQTLRHGRSLSGCWWPYLAQFRNFKLARVRSQATVPQQNMHNSGCQPAAAYRYVRRHAKSCQNLCLKPRCAQLERHCSADGLCGMWIKRHTVWQHAGIPVLPLLKSSLRTVCATGRAALCGRLHLHITTSKCSSSRWHQATHLAAAAAVKCMLQQQQPSSACCMAARLCCGCAVSQILPCCSPARWRFC